MEELSNKDVYLKYISNILLLNIPENFNKPLKVAMWRANPQKVHLQLHGYTVNTHSQSRKASKHSLPTSVYLTFLTKP